MVDRIHDKIKSGFPVSYAQRRMWFLSRLESKKLLNNSSIKAWLEGDLQVNFFKKAFQTLVARHETFRTNFFQASGGEVIQVVNRFEKVRFNYHDLRLFEPAEKRRLSREAELDNIKHKFDLSRDNLIRASLIRLTEKKYIFIMTLHHIVSDAWTLALFWNELSEVYECFVTGLPLGLPPLAIQYKDYAVWEQSSEYLQQFSGQKKYWLNNLHGAPALTVLPLDFPRPQVQTYNHGAVIVHLERGLVNEIDRICQRLNVTNYTFLLACFVIFLKNLNNASDVVVGTYVANRDQAELERVAGTLLNNLAIRSFPESQKSLVEFISDLNQTVLAAMSNKEYPFEKLIEDLKIERSANHAPLFNIVFQVFTHDMNFIEKTFSGFKKKIDLFNSDFFQHDIVVRIGISEKKFGFNFNYNKDLFSQHTAQQLALGFKKAIELNTRAYDKKLGSIKIFSDSEIKNFTKKCFAGSRNSQLNNSEKPINQEQADIEKQIISIWQEVLLVKRISREDDFFRLGGHSLKLIQVYDRLEQIFPGEISIAELFNYFTVASLGEHLSNKIKLGKQPIKFDSKKEFAQIIDAVKHRRSTIEEAVDRIWEI